MSNHIFSAFRSLHPWQNHVFCFSQKNCYFFTLFMVPLSLCCPQCSTYEQNFSTVWVIDLHLTTFGNGTIFSDVTNFIKCGRRATKSYVQLDEFLPIARLVDLSQSNPFFFCCCTGMIWTTHFLDKMNMLQVCELHLTVFLAKISYQKYALKEFSAGHILDTNPVNWTCK